MPISFKYFLKCEYHSEIGGNEDYLPFEEWLSQLSYKDLCDYGEDYLDSTHAKIHHLFNLNDVTVNFLQK